MNQNYRHLTNEERIEIDLLLQEGKSIRYIAKKLQRHPSTISRERERNSGKRKYCCRQAQKKSCERKHKTKYLKMTPEVIAYINEKIEFDLSPEQITLIIEKDIGVSLSHERIYQHIYKDKNEGGSLYKHLRINHKKRYRRNRKKQNWRLKIPDRVDIDRRPDKINNRFRYGDWEADLVVGSDQKRFLVTLTERKSLFEVAGFVDGKSSGAVSKKIKELLLEFKKRVYSITYDNGPEFSMHMHTNEVLNCYSYFAKPYHAWERGANENQNGLLRQYFPKGTDFRNYSEGDVERAIYRMNNRPRKSRGGKTPNELLYRVLART